MRILYFTLLLSGCTAAATSAPSTETLPPSPIAIQLTGDAQRTTSALRWTKHTASALGSAQVTLAVCNEHFPIGSEVRTEIEQAVALYNNLTASSARITTIDEPHRSVAEIFDETNAVNRIDYLDTLSTEYAGFPCHPLKDDTTCESWVMNTCRYRKIGGFGHGSGKVTSFVISVNRNCYDHFSDPASKDHPHVSGVAHELGHGFGMEHTTVWPEADRDLISTMQGNLTVLSAYDVAFMRHHYPAEGVSSHILASPRLRLNVLGKYATCYAAEGNEQGAFPREMYRDGGGWKDCATGAPPTLKFMWFNDGTEGLTDVRGSVSLGEKPLVNWTAADLESASQDAITQSLALLDGHLSGLANDEPITGKITVSATNGTTSLSTSLPITVTLRQSHTACQKAKANECTDVGVP